MFPHAASTAPAPPPPSKGRVRQSMPPSPRSHAQIRNGSFAAWPSQASHPHGLQDAPTGSRRLAKRKGSPMPWLLATCRVRVPAGTSRQAGEEGQ
jgi:hypothetical protein